METQNIKTGVNVFRNTWLVALALLLICNVKASADEPVKEKPRMLMVTQSKGYRHSPVNRKKSLMAPSEKAMKLLGEKTGLFEVDFTQDCATHLTKENLQKYSLVAFYTSGDLPVATKDLKYLLEQWVHQPGNGFLGFHSATDTYKEHEPYWDYIGGSFNGHPWTSNTPVTMKVHDTEHPAMKPFGAEFEITEEIYQYKNWQPEKVRVLMSIDMNKTDLKRPWHVPVAWVKETGKGKMFYTNIGHRDDSWENEKFLKSIEGAVKWLQGTEAGEVTPNPEVSKAQHEDSVKAAAAEGITVESLAAKERAQEERKRANEERKKKKAAAEAAKRKTEAEKQAKNEKAGAGK